MKIVKIIVGAFFYSKNEEKYSVNVVVIIII